MHCYAGEPHNSNHDIFLKKFHWCVINKPRELSAVPPVAGSEPPLLPQPRSILRDTRKSGETQGSQGRPRRIVSFHLPDYLQLLPGSDDGGDNDGGERSESSDGVWAEPSAEEEANCQPAAAQE